MSVLITGLCGMPDARDGQRAIFSIIINHFLPIAALTRPWIN
jgi:hypothetical protein